jgi:hypothetical protein
MRSSEQRRPLGVVDLVELTAIGTGRYGAWLRVSHRGTYIGEARDWDGAARLGGDISDLRETRWVMPELSRGLWPSWARSPDRYRPSSATARAWYLSLALPVCCTPSPIVISC